MYEHGLNDQWIQDGRMYKVVLPGLCDGCDFNMGCLQNGGVSCKSGHCVTQQGHVKDLGSVNEDGFLPMPCDGKTYPEVAVLIGDVWQAKAQSGSVFMEARGRGEQECKDAWNQRAIK